MKNLRDQFLAWYAVRALDENVAKQRLMCKFGKHDYVTTSDTYRCCVTHKCRACPYEWSYTMWTQGRQHKGI